MTQFDKNAANVSLKTVLIELFNRLDEQTSENGFKVDDSATPEKEVNLTKINGTVISDSNPLPVKSKSYNEITGNNKIEHAGAIPLVIGSAETLLSGQSISGDTNSSDYIGARNWKEFLAEIVTTDTGSTSEATYTLTHRIDNSSDYYTVKDKYGNDCTWTVSLSASESQSKLFELSGYYQNIRIEITGVTNSQTPNVKVHPRK